MNELKEELTYFQGMLMDYLDNSDYVAAEIVANDIKSTIRQIIDLEE